jgi:hypothetical protein
VRRLDPAAVGIRIQPSRAIERGVEPGGIDVEGDLVGILGRPSARLEEGQDHRAGPDRVVRAGERLGVEQLEVERAQMGRVGRAEGDVVDPVDRHGESVGRCCARVSHR